MAKAWAVLLAVTLFVGSSIKADEAALAKNLDSLVIYSKESPGRFIRIYKMDSRTRVETCEFQTVISCKSLGRPEGYSAEEAAYYAGLERQRASNLGFSTSYYYLTPIFTLFPQATWTGIKFFGIGFVARGVAVALMNGAWIKSFIPVLAPAVKHVGIVAGDHSIPFYMAISNFAIYYVNHLPEEWKKARAKQVAVTSVPRKAGELLGGPTVMAVEIKGTLDAFEQEFTRAFKVAPQGLPASSKR